MATLNLCIDQGNTRIKIAVFQGPELISSSIISQIQDIPAWLISNDFHVGHSIWSSSADEPSALEIPGKMTVLEPDTPLPVKIEYDNYKSLGNDRKANACAAMVIFPNKNCLVIDAGTCITYDLIRSDKTFIGGAISPGLEMRAKAMHRFTSRLPEIKAPFENLTSGNSTSSCLVSGILHGALLEAEGRIEELSQQLEDLHVLLCGGDASYFESGLKNPTFADSNLTLRGLNEILQFLK